MAKVKSDGDILGLEFSRYVFLLFFFVFVLFCFVAIGPFLAEI